jgi:hypothetical protein
LSGIGVFLIFILVAGLIITSSKPWWRTMTI